MYKPLPFHILLLAALLVASNVVLVTHATAHIDGSLGSCEWCVCQGQTAVGPLPSAGPVVVEQCAAPPPVPLQSLQLPVARGHTHQPRAPPATR